MPKPRLEVFRADFRGGRNTAMSPDLLNSNELVQSTNARLDGHGAFGKRSGTRRMHSTAIGAGAPVRGLVQWHNGTSNQIVAIANGRLYHKITEFGEFAEVIPGAGDEFSTTNPTHFATFREAAPGAPLRLYAASGGKFYRFDGTTLARIDGIDNAPQLRFLKPYHTRMFGVTVSLPKHVFWSRIGDPEFWTIALQADGGSAMVDVLSGDAVNFIETIGSSLLIATEDSIVRFTGYSNDDIQVSQDVSGISAEVGVVGELAAVRAEQVIALMSDRGPYFAVESGVSSFGSKIEPDLDAVNRTVLSSTVAGHHRQRREIWFAVSGASDSGLNKTMFVFDYRLQAWCGPFTYPFGITYLTRYEDSSGSEWVISGGSDGFVRHMDIGVRDDVLFDGTAGSTYTMTVEVAPEFFATGPGILKTLNSLAIQADLPVGSALVVAHAFDNDSFTSEPALTGLGAGSVRSYPLDIYNQGYRLRLRFTDASADLPIVAGYALMAYNMERRS